MHPNDSELFKQNFEIDRPLSSSPSPVPCFAGASILLVEDNLMNQEIATWWLARTGARTTIASNGMEALRLAQTTPFDLILMDLQMPEMDGYTAARHIRTFLPTIPMVALSAASLDHDRQLSGQAGMDDHLAKPIEEKELYRVLGKWLKTSGATLPPSTSPLPDVALPPALDGFDLKRGLRLADGNALFYLQTLHRFREQLQDEFSSLATRLKNHHDPAATARQIHTLKGIAGTVGAQSLADTAAAIDRTLRQGSPAEKSLFDALEDALARALASLNTLPPLPPPDPKPNPLPGEQSLHLLLQTLRNQDWVDDSLLSSAEIFLSTRLGKESAQQLRKWVETFNYRGAITMLAPLLENPMESTPHE